MTRGRFVATAAGVALAALAGLLAPLPAAAQTATKTQQQPYTEWGYQASGPTRTGMGTWLYVLPQPAARPGQLPREGYRYELTFIFQRLRLGTIGIGTGPNGPVAQLEIQDVAAGGPKIVAEVAYDWSPGRFYFVYTQLLPNGDAAGWIMDWERAVWTYIGSVHPPVDWGKMVDASFTSAKWAGPAVAADCSGYPRSDAYFFPVLAYTGTTFEIGTFFDDRHWDGDCPAGANILDNGWVHYQLGV